MRDGRSDGQTNGGSDEVFGASVPASQRERITVRRRRARQGHRPGPKWGAARSRRQLVRTFALCAGALLVMAIGLYFGLSHQEGAGPGAARGVPVGFGIV
jgi:preprotein translocase subunit SecG